MDSIILMLRIISFVIILVIIILVYTHLVLGLYMRYVKTPYLNQLQLTHDDLVYETFKDNENKKYGNLSLYGCFNVRHNNFFIKAFCKNKKYFIKDKIIYDYIMEECVKTKL